MTKNIRTAFSRIMFYLLVFLWPLNLGYHFMINDAYIRGLLIDYLLPVIYVQDLLVFLLVLLNLDTLIKRLRQVDKFLVWFVFAAGLSSLASAFLVTSLTLWTRLALYVCLTLVIKENYGKREDFKDVVGISGLTVLLLSILALFQWKFQSSVFDNYLFFGEQPYNISTPGINVENFMGEARVPAYGTFRHPNVFGGLLSIVLVWFLFKENKSRLTSTALVAGIGALIFTLSKFAWISFLLGVLYYVLEKHKNQWAQTIIMLIMFVFVTASLFLPYIPDYFGIGHKPSYYRRADLLHSAYRLIGTRPFFGVGYGTSTAYIDSFLPPEHDVRFAQPPHNIFVLLLTEAGAFSLLFFALYLFKKVRFSLKNPVIFISLMQIMFLGVFDHYFFTMHQAQLLFWLILGYV